MTIKNRQDIPFFSIIMPIYNSERYLNKAIGCLINQSFTDFELILVDDGSSDLSPSICDRFANEDQRIHVIHQENRGICAARNTGLSYARGKYIAFCDNDDEIDQNCFQLLYKKISESGSDVVRFRRCKKTSEKEKGTTTHYFMENVFEVDSWINYLNAVMSVGYGVWTSVYRRMMIEEYHIRFNEEFKYGYEDHLFNMDACSRANRVQIIPNILYTWIQRKNVSTSCKSSEDAIDNRLKSIVCWREKEMDIASKLNASSEDMYNRQFEYLKYYALELKKSVSSIRVKKTKYQAIASSWINDNAYKESKLKYSTLGFKKRVCYFLLKHGMLRTLYLLGL